MNTVTPKDRLLVVSKGGYGKASRLSLYPTHRRNGQGVRTFRVTDKTGPVTVARVVPDEGDFEVFIISSKAQVVRINLEDVRMTGRATQGVILWRDRSPDDFVASVTLFHHTEYTQAPPSTNGHTDTDPPTE